MNETTGDSPVHERKGQEGEDRRGVQPTVQHDGGGFKLEDIARQCGMTRQTVLKEGGNYQHYDSETVQNQLYRKLVS